ncbi:MAG: hypothetical protein ACFFCT_00215 [Candidatus Odinarchaeota archaeon]
MKSKLRSMILISITFLVLLGALWFPTAAFDIKKNVVSDTGTLILTGSTGPFYYSNVSVEHSISWTVNTTTSNSISCQLLHNGTILQSRVFEAGESTIIYAIQPRVLPLATHNFTLVATDEIETKSWTVLVTIYYSGTSNLVDLGPWGALIAAAFGLSVIMYLSRSQRLMVPVRTPKH